MEVASDSAELDSGLPSPMMLSLMAPQVMPLLVSEASMLTPSCFITERLTSATVTFKVTWSSPMICKRLMIWLCWRCASGLSIATPPSGEPPAAVMAYWPVVASPPVTKICASCWARCASSGVSTVPVSTTLSFSSSTVMSEFGMNRLRYCSRPATSRSIARSRLAICSPLAPKTKMLVSPTCLPKR